MSNYLRQPCSSICGCEERGPDGFTYHQGMACYPFGMPVYTTTPLCNIITGTGVSYPSSAHSQIYSSETVTWTDDATSVVITSVRFDIDPLTSIATQTVLVGSAVSIGFCFSPDGTIGSTTYAVSSGGITRSGVLSNAISNTYDLVAEVNSIAYLRPWTYATEGAYNWSYYPIHAYETNPYNGTTDLPAWGRYPEDAQTTPIPLLFAGLSTTRAVNCYFFDSSDDTSVPQPADFASRIEAYSNRCIKWLDCFYQNPASGVDHRTTYFHRYTVPSGSRQQDWVANDAFGNVVLLQTGTYADTGIVPAGRNAKVSLRSPGYYIWSTSATPP